MRRQRRHKPTVALTTLIKEVAFFDIIMKSILKYIYIKE